MMEPPRLPVLLGQRIRELRVTKGLTQWEIAERGFSYKYYQRIEAGKVNLTLNSLEKLATALDVEVGELFRFPFPPRAVAAEANRVVALVTSLIAAGEQDALRKVRLFITEILDWQGGGQPL
jgi:transcriptional regulator with XRE-family HTH domain